MRPREQTPKGKRARTLIPCERASGVSPCERASGASVGAAGRRVCERPTTAPSTKGGEAERAPSWGDSESGRGGWVKLGGEVKDVPRRRGKARRCGRVELGGRDRVVAWEVCRPRAAIEELTWWAVGSAAARTLRRSAHGAHRRRRRRRRRLRTRSVGAASEPKGTTLTAAMEDGGEDEFITLGSNGRMARELRVFLSINGGGAAVDRGDRSARYEIVTRRATDKRRGVGAAVRGSSPGPRSHGAGAVNLAAGDHGMEGEAAGRERRGVGRQSGESKGRRREGTQADTPVLRARCDIVWDDVRVRGNAKEGRVVIVGE